MSNNCLEVITNSLEEITNKADWDALLLEIKEYDFNHTYDSHLLEKKENEIPVLLKYTEGDIIIGLPLLIRKVFNTSYKDATSIWGYGGPISKGVVGDFDNSLFIKAINEYFDNNNIISVFSRLDPYISNQKVILKNYGNIVLNGKVVYIDLTQQPKIQKQKYQRRLKTYINKIRRSCLVKEVYDEGSLKTFMKLYYESMDRVKAKSRYYFDYKYFRKVFGSKDFKTYLLLATNNISGEVVGGAMFIKVGNILQYHLSGSKEKASSLTPTKLLIDEMRLNANNMNCKYFNLGGGVGGSKNDSLFEFKSSFSKETKDFELWKLVVNQKAYSKIVKSKNIDRESNFFPLYRYTQDDE